MDLRAAHILCNGLLADHGFVGRGWRFRLDNAVRRAGCCHQSTHLITISRHYIALNDELYVRNTMLHEIAHALVGPGHGHDRVWKAQAIAIGCTGDRCYDSNVVVMPERQVVAKCPCGREYTRHRLPRAGDMDRYRCPACKSPIRFARV